MSASWCASCFSAIDFIDQLEECWSGQNPNVKFVTALADIGEPYSCNDWGNADTPGSPLIVEDDGTLFNWFQDSNGQYPNYVLIDHTMTVRAQPSSVLSNGNNNECDSSSEDMVDWECEGNINLDPMFTNPESGDYTLQEGSPCIDSGIAIEGMEY